MKAVHYQQDEADAMTHEYVYDKLNRLEEVSTTGFQEQHASRQAHYRYYDYGPLARVELGQYKVQGMDYFYTINGWLKGMNSSLLNNEYDLGRDGSTGYQQFNDIGHRLFAKDVASYTLGYFSGDYTAIDGNSQLEATYSGSAFDLAANNLYNGNIRSLVTSIEGMQALGTAYRYDQLQRLKSMTAFYYNTPTATTNSWSTATATNDYFNSYSYDKNGNITNLQRNGAVTSSTGLYMDNFVYHYMGLDGLDEASTGSRSNRLNYFTDNGSDDADYTEDIKSGQLSGNYQYDALGRLTANVQEGINSIEWTYGDNLIKKIVRDNQNSPEVEFVYNPFGQRVLKIVKPRQNGAIQDEDQWKYTYYSYAGDGELIAVYNVKMSASVSSAEVTEHHLYGASRLGMRKSDVSLYNNGVVTYTEPLVYEHTLGKTFFEITNYLGNVNAVITDRRIVDQSSTATSIYIAVVVSTADYYPYGMLMPERHTEGSDYRYGFQGMEMDNEVSGDGNSYTTDFRQYDPRLGRWLSLDPLMAEFPDISPYAAFDDNPILYSDPEGLAPGPGWLSVVSTVLDFVPVVGQIKAVAEAAIGYSLDGSRLSATDRILAMASLIPGGAILSKAGKVFTKAFKVVKSSKIAGKAKIILKKASLRFKSNVVEKAVHGNSKLSTKRQHLGRVSDYLLFDYFVKKQQLNYCKSKKSANLALFLMGKSLE